MTERIRPRIEDRIGILNPYGQLWTDDTFTDHKAAARHLREFWAKNKDFDIRRYSYAPVVVTVAVVDRPAEQVKPTPFAKDD